MACFCSLHLGDISEKVSHALYDTLIYILKTGMPDFPTTALLRHIEGA